MATRTQTFQYADIRWERYNPEPIRIVVEVGYPSPEGRYMARIAEASEEVNFTWHIHGDYPLQAIERLCLDVERVTTRKVQVVKSLNRKGGE